MKSVVPDHVPVDAEALRSQVRHKYREVALDPGADFHFHTGVRQALRLGYQADVVADVPDAASEAFAGVANPFALRRLHHGERVVDVGSGGGFDSFVAAAAVGDTGSVVGVDMTLEMLQRARAATVAAGRENVEFREGLAEALPVGDAWADVVISNGVINLVADKRRAFEEIHRVLRPGGVLQFADIANGRPVPDAAIADIDLWTA
ncbi:MAG: methyltransferase domain-containing protein [Actinobacteria bacterium]|nr:methyltransferase domain-containing protein [Actinomycetota bacterium]